MKLKTFVLLVSFFSLYDCKKINKNDQNTTLIFGISSQYPPLTFVQNGKIVGFDIDLAKMIGKKLHRQVEFKDMEFQSIFPAINSHKIDAGIGCISVTEDRKKNFDFSIPYRFEEIALLHLDQNKKYEIDELHNLKIGVQFGSVNEIWAMKHFDTKNLVGINNMIQLIKMLKNRQIDVVLTSKSHAIEFLKEDEELNWNTIGVSDSGCAVLLKKNSILADDINDVLREIMDREDFQTMKEKWRL